MTTHPTPSVTDVLHDLLNAVKTLREMREEAERVVAEMEARWASNREIRSC